MLTGSNACQHIAFNHDFYSESGSEGQLLFYYNRTC